MAPQVRNFKQYVHDLVGNNFSPEKIYIFIYRKYKMAFVYDGDKNIATGNFHDFNPNVHGLREYNGKKIGFFSYMSLAQELSRTAKKTIEKVELSEKDYNRTFNIH